MKVTWIDEGDKERKFNIRIIITKYIKIYEHMTENVNEPVDVQNNVVRDRTLEHHAMGVTRSKVGTPGRTPCAVDVVPQKCSLQKAKTLRHRKKQQRFVLRS